jgi:hypothetical protein
LNNTAQVENPCRLAYIKSMRRDDVIAKLKETEPVLRAFGVAALYLFARTRVTKQALTPMLMSLSMSRPTRPLA